MPENPSQLPQVLFLLKTKRAGDSANAARTLKIEVAAETLHIGKESRHHGSSRPDVRYCYCNLIVGVNYRVV